MHGIEIDVLTAFRRKNRSLLQQYINREIRLYYDVYIAVDESFRASVICCPSSVDEELANRNNPYQLHNQTKVLVFETIQPVIKVQQQQQQQPHCAMKEMPWSKVFVNLSSLFYIGRYRGLSRDALQVAALEATPRFFSLHRRDFAMDFCKRFCRILLQFCTDDVELCNQVHRQIERLPSRAIAITKPTSICGVNIDDYIFCLISIISAFVAILLYYGQR